MKKIAVLALFLISITGYGQKITSYSIGNEILDKFGVFKPTTDNKHSIGRCIGFFETPHGVFMNSREWVDEHKNSFRSIVYLYHNETLKEVDKLQNFVIYDYSTDLNSFILGIGKNVQALDEWKTMYSNLYTYNLNNENPILQKEISRFKILNAKFVTDNQIEYEIYENGGNTKFKVDIK